LLSPHGIRAHLREPTRAENGFFTRFLSQKAVVLYDEKDGFIGKKRRYLTQETALLKTDSYFCRHQKRLSR